MEVQKCLHEQLEVQKCLHEQLEVRRQLQVRIEAQGKYLEKIIEEQQKLEGALKVPNVVASVDNKGNSSQSEPPSDVPTESFTS